MRIINLEKLYLVIGTDCSALRIVTIIRNYSWQWGQTQTNQIYFTYYPSSPYVLWNIISVQACTHPTFHLWLSAKGAISILALTLEANKSYIRIVHCLVFKKKDGNVEKHKRKSTSIKTQTLCNKIELLFFIWFSLLY